MVAGEVTSEQTPILDCRVVVERGSFDLDAEVGGDQRVDLLLLLDRFLLLHHR